jgi:hypothetical protein
MLINIASIKKLNMTKKINLLASKFTLLFFLSGAVSAQVFEENECSNETSSGRYQYQHQIDEFVVLYNLTGDKAITVQTDINNNEIPDIVENIALQIVTIRDVLEALDFKHPFNQYRYQRAEVEHIYVAIRDLNGNGLAFDPPHRDMSHEDEPCVLLISLSNKLKTGNLTPAHELFHLYQYGYTVFKNSWYLEGMARWAENLLGKRNYPTGIIPKQPSDKEALFVQSYDAISFWMAFLNAVSSPTKGERNYPDELLSRRYINGEKIIKNESSTYGAAAIIDVLESLDDLDTRVSQKTGRTLKSWSNAERFEKANSDPIFKALMGILDDSVNSR